WEDRRPASGRRRRPGPLVEVTMITVRPGRRAALATVVAGLLALLLTGCTEPGAEPSTPPEPSSSPTETTEPSPTPETADLEVYAMTDTGTELRLVRELRAVPDPTVEAAVELMIVGPVDPDYVSPWNTSTRVLGVTQDAGTVVVDLSADARTANIGSAGAALMIEQLVWTASAAVGDPAAPVLLTIEGAPAGELWGAVVWDVPLTRSDPISVRLLVQIDEPREGATSASPLTVSGEAAVFEATLPWRVLDTAGTEVAAGVAMTAEGQTFAPFSFTVDLEPGTYSIEITEDDPSGGEGRPPMVDTRTVTIG
ncbi:MAG TPA: Gmad2 immunoglobulin-like domain-containing protein, partial [Actinotalea sp.]|nr:Gmad2 immunoglobulin-like domain-containing protein [Actinotalea sp.]